MRSRWDEAPFITCWLGFSLPSSRRCSSSRLRVSTGLSDGASAPPTSFYTFDPLGNATMLTYGYGAQYGYYRDSEASTSDNLLLCTHRWYDPATARWLTRDPIGYAGGSNLYGYVGENPVGGVDPQGLKPVDIWSAEKCNSVASKLNTMYRSIAEHERELQQDPLGLPKTHPNQKATPRVSKEAHRIRVNMEKAQYAILWAAFIAHCLNPRGMTMCAVQPVTKRRLQPQPAIKKNGFDWEKAGKVTGVVVFDLLFFYFTRATPEKGGARGFCPEPIKA